MDRLGQAGVVVFILSGRRMFDPQQHQLPVVLHV